MLFLPSYISISNNSEHGTGGCSRLGRAGGLCPMGDRSGKQLVAQEGSLARWVLTDATSPFPVLAHLLGCATDRARPGTDADILLCLSTGTAWTWPRTTALTCSHNTESNTNKDKVSNPLLLVLTHSQGSCSAPYPTATKDKTCCLYLHSTDHTCSSSRAWEQKAASSARGR